MLPTPAINQFDDLLHRRKSKNLGLDMKVTDNHVAINVPFWYSSFSFSEISGNLYIFMLGLWKNISLKLFLGFNLIFSQSKDVRLSSAEGKCTMHDESFKSPAEHASKLTVSGSSNHGQRDEKVGEQDAKEITSNLDWKPLERDLYLKGIEVFGKNRYGVSHTENT